MAAAARIRGGSALFHHLKPIFARDSRSGLSVTVSFSTSKQASVGGIPLTSQIRWISSGEGSDHLFRNAVKNGVKDGLSNAIKVLKDDVCPSVMQSVLKEAVDAGVAAAIKEANLSVQPDCPESDDLNASSSDALSKEKSDSRLRLLVREAVEEALKTSGYNSTKGASNWCPLFGMPGSADPHDPRKEDFDPRRVALMQCVVSCMSKSDDGVEDGSSSEQHPDAEKYNYNQDPEWKIDHPTFWSQRGVYERSGARDAKRREVRHAEEAAARYRDNYRFDQLDLLVKKGFKHVVDDLKPVKSEVALVKELAAAEAAEFAEFKVKLENMSRLLDSLKRQEEMRLAAAVNVKLWAHRFLQKAVDDLPWGLPRVVKGYPFALGAFLYLRYSVDPVTYFLLTCFYHDDMMEPYLKKIASLEAHRDQKIEIVTLEHLNLSA